jgi:hypothetical protein
MVSIPTDLKRRMDKVADQVNWSAVAAQAFERKLGEISDKKETKSMQDVIQRLRGLKAAEGNKAFLEGKIVGERWARHTASPVEMQRLEMNPLFGDLFDGEPPARHSIFFAIRPDCNGDEHSSVAFWEDQGIRKDQQQDEDFLRGWVDGVLGLWDAVKAEVNK